MASAEVDRVCMMNFRELVMASWVAEGTLMLKETMGTGSRETVLNEEIVMPRYLSWSYLSFLSLIFGSAGLLTSVDVTTTTPCGILRMA